MTGKDGGGSSVEAKIACGILNQLFDLGRAITEQIL